MIRQYRLQNAGWRFARVRESLFYSDESRAIAEVTAACEELDITPGSGRARTASAEAPMNVAEDFVGEDHPPQAQATDNDEVPQFSRSAVDEEAELWESEPEAAYLQGTLGLGASGEQRTGPFTGYGAKHYPDPRTAPTANLREAVLDIITTDGPLPKESLYRLYREGCPRVERAGKNLRHAVNRAVYSLERVGLVMSRDEGTRRQPSEVVIKLPSHQWVEPRPPGSRRLEDVPLSELGMAMSDASYGLQPRSDYERTSLYREVAGRYGVRRLMAQPLQRLGLAERIAFSSGAGDGVRPFGVSLAIPAASE